MASASKDEFVSPNMQFTIKENKGFKRNDY
jgi:hypothetical protein